MLYISYLCILYERYVSLNKLYGIFFKRSFFTKSSTSAYLVVLLKPYIHRIINEKRIYMLLIPLISQSTKVKLLSNLLPIMAPAPLK